MRLVVRVVVARLSALVQEELRLVQVLLLARGEVQLREGHLGDLVAGDDAGLAGAGAHFTDHAVRVADGDVQEVALAGGLPVRHGRLHHMAQVIELVAQLLVVHPALVARPLVRMLGVHRPGRVQVAVRLLGLRHDGDDAVDIRLQFLVRIGLEHVGGAFDGLIDVRVVEGVPLHLQPQVHRGVQLPRGHLEVLVPALALALGERQRDGDLAGRLQALPPEGIRGHLHAREGDGVDGIAGGRGLRLEGDGGQEAGQGKETLDAHSDGLMTFRRR